MVNKFELNEYVIAPGETILELLDANSMTQLDLADKTGINKIILNKMTLTRHKSLKVKQQLLKQQH